MKIESTMYHTIAMTSACIYFEKYRKLSKAVVTVSKNRDEVTFEVFEKSDEPVWSLTLDDLQSSNFMKGAREGFDSMPKGSKMRAFDKDFEEFDVVKSRKSKKKGKAWGIATTTRTAKKSSSKTDTASASDDSDDRTEDGGAVEYQEIHPEEYFEYGVHGYLEPLYKKTGVWVSHVLAIAAVELLAGRSHTGWLPEGTTFNGTYLRHETYISGRLPGTTKLLREWDPRGVQWR